MIKAVASKFEISDGPHARSCTMVARNVDAKSRRGLKTRVVTPGPLSTLAFGRNGLVDRGKQFYV
jgi:hypothetical protein